MASIIDITDLNKPILTPQQQQALDYSAANPVTFSEDAILEAARAETGLDNFGADDFRERLAVWIDAIDADSGLSALNRAGLLKMCIRYASARLRIEDAIDRHPEILSIPIERPIVVAGLPRSGTTHLLSLLSADERLRSLPWWEAVSPVPTADDAPTTEDPNPRWTRAEADWQMLDGLLPYMKAMHEFSPDHISEDIELQAVDFSSYLLEWLVHAPQWRDYYLSHDQSGTYAYLKRTMQVLTFFRGPRRWVIKCPQHMEQLPVLVETFPDATFVLTHRDPVASIQSAVTMHCYAARIMRNHIDSKNHVAYWTDRYGRLLDACVRDRDLLPSNQTIDVYFHEWTTDPDPILKRIFEMADLPLTEAGIANLHAYNDAHPHGHQGKVIYDLRRDFGVTPSKMRQRFQSYMDRFPVRIEVE